MKCENCGRSEGVEIGDYDEYGVLCEKCAKQIVPKSWYMQNESQQVITYKLGRSTVPGEFVVKAYVNGKFNDDMSYYTDDREDAVATMADLNRREQEKNRKLGEDMSPMPKFRDMMIKKGPPLVKQEAEQQFHPNDPENPENQSPDMCANCGAYQEPGEQGSVMMMDLDPGDAEVGPQPDIGEHWVCNNCTAYKTKFGKLPEITRNPRMEETEEQESEDFETVAESLIAGVDNFEEGYWYEMVNPRYEYRGTNKNKKIIALPPRFVTGNLFESKEGRFVRLENKINDQLLAQYGMRRVESNS